MTLLPVQPAHTLPQRAEDGRWLIDGLWGDQAVGIVGGEPKCFKSFLALDMAVAVAAGVPCLRRFPVVRPGRVLLFAAEDALPIVRARLEGIGRAAGVDLADLDVQVITAPSLRLDLTADQERLTATVAALRPALLILDPFVRLHRIDENASADVAPLLAYLRDLQRHYQLAVVVVHHARKGAARVREGQALRGSSEFHAWGDSNLYLRRHHDQLTLSVEHRAAPSRTGIPLSLRADTDALALEVLDRPAPAGALPPAPSGPVRRRPGRTGPRRRDRPCLAGRPPARVPHTDGHPLRHPRHADRGRSDPQDPGGLSTRQLTRAVPFPVVASLQGPGNGNGKRAHRRPGAATRSPRDSIPGNPSLIVAGSVGGVGIARRCPRAAGRERRPPARHLPPTMPGAARSITPLN